MAPSSANALLDGVQLPARGQAFDGDDRAALRLAHRRDAGEDRLVVEQNGAGARHAPSPQPYLAPVSPAPRAALRQRPVRLGLHATRLSVHGESNGRHLLAL